jgi:hemerythrin-like domain-containing protein
LATRDQVRALVEQGCDYPEIGRRLGVPPGQAYLIGTGMPAQHLPGTGAVNPTPDKAVLEWLQARAHADATMQAAEQRRDAAPPRPEDPDDHHDVITVLGRDHNHVKVLLKRLNALPSHTKGGTPAQASARKSIVDMITVALSRHESVEEEFFWPAVRRALPNGGELADGALEQEQQGRDVLTSLGRLEPNTDEFDQLVERLSLLLRKHVAYEEKVFLQVKSAMSAEDLDALWERPRRGEKAAPTRPHRRAPKKPATRKGKTAKDAPDEGEAK